MDLCTRGNGKMTCNMAKVKKFGIKDRLCTQEISLREKRLGKVSLNSMRASIKATSSMDSLMEKANITSLIQVKFTKEISEKIKCMETGSWCGLIKQDVKAYLKMEK